MMPPPGSTQSGLWRKTVSAASTWGFQQASALNRSIGIRSPLPAANKSWTASPTAAAPKQLHCHQASARAAAPPWFNRFLEWRLAPHRYGPQSIEWFAFSHTACRPYGNDEYQTVGASLASTSEVGGTPASFGLGLANDPSRIGPARSANRG